MQRKIPKKLLVKFFPLGLLLHYCEEFRTQNPLTCNACPAKKLALCIDRQYIDLDMVSESLEEHLNNPLEPTFKGFGR